MLNRVPMNNQINELENFNQGVPLETHEGSPYVSDTSFNSEDDEALAKEKT